MRLSLARVLWIAAALALLAGCSYDYLAHTDRVAYSAGDAVHANLEAETANPDTRSAYDTTGLGKNGPQTPSAAASSTP